MIQLLMTDWDSNNVPVSFLSCVSFCCKGDWPETKSVGCEIQKICELISTPGSWHRAETPVISKVKRVFGMPTGLIFVL